MSPLIERRIVMKKALLFLALAALVLSPVLAQTKLDVKTKFTSKFEMKGVKHGVIYYLEQMGYKIVEVKEEYSVWLTDFEEKLLEGNKYAIKFLVKIEPPALFTEKTPLATKEVKGEFAFDAKVLTTDAGFMTFIKSKVKDMKEKENIQAMQVGKLAADEVQALLTTLKK
jgi:hypothetical protein